MFEIGNRVKRVAGGINYGMKVGDTGVIIKINDSDVDVLMDKNGEISQRNHSPNLEKLDIRNPSIIHLTKLLKERH